MRHTETLTQKLWPDSDLCRFAGFRWDLVRTEVNWSSRSQEQTLMPDMNLSDTLEARHLRLSLTHTISLVSSLFPHSVRACVEVAGKVSHTLRGSMPGGDTVRGEAMAVRAPGSRPFIFLWGKEMSNILTNCEQCVMNKHYKSSVKLLGVGWFDQKFLPRHM